jgi:hypothetical protein
MKVPCQDKEYPKDYETLLKEFKELEFRYKIVKADLDKMLKAVGAE